MRMRLIDRDGSLVSNRKVSDEWIDSYKNDAAYRGVSISSECKEHGVTHISHSFVDGDIVVLVKYPKEK